MEDNFRNVLIILSGIVIGAIFIHGLWTIRKQKNPYKLKASKEKSEPLTRNFDGKGFDQDGVGQVIIKKQSDEHDSFDEKNERSAAIDADLLKSINNQAIDDIDESTDKANCTESVSAPDQENNLSDLLEDNYDDRLDGTQNEHWNDNNSAKNFSKDELGDDLTPKLEAIIKEPVEPVYQQPVINAKPIIQPTRQTIRKAPSKAELKRNQMEINFDDSKIKDADVEMPSISISELDKELEKESSKETIRPESQTLAPNMSKPTRLEPQVIIISVVMPANQQMLGASLLPSLLTLGLKYGEMNIFHRHQDSAGNGEVTFSVANMMKPGAFDLDSMETFATQGVSLFMMLPNAADPFAVFEQMLNAAKQLAQEFNGQVLDDKRNVMTKQTEQHYVSKIREFDRKSRIALVK